VKCAVKCCVKCGDALRPPGRQGRVPHLVGLGVRRHPRRVGRAVNAPHLVALVRPGAVFHKGKLLERPTNITPPQSADSTDPTTGTEAA
jgi:hypothetical protein